MGVGWSVRAFVEWESTTEILSETGREESKRAPEAPDCVIVKDWLERSWCEKWSGVGAKQEALHQ